MAVGWPRCGGTKIKARTARFDNLQVTCFSEDDTKKLAKLASRAMKIQVNT